MEMQELSKLLGEELYILRDKDVTPRRVEISKLIDKHSKTIIRAEVIRRKDIYNKG